MCIQPTQEGSCKDLTEDQNCGFPWLTIVQVITYVLMLPNINSCGILPFSYWLKIKFKGGTWITCFAYPNGSLLKSHHRNQYVRQWISVCKYKTIFRRGVKIRTIYFRILDWQSPTKIIYPGRLLLITEVKNFLFSMAATHPITNTANIV